MPTKEEIQTLAQELSKRLSDAIEIFEQQQEIERLRAALWEIEGLAFGPQDSFVLPEIQTICRNAIGVRPALSRDSAR